MAVDLQTSIELINDYLVSVIAAKTFSDCCPVIDLSAFDGTCVWDFEIVYTNGTTFSRAITLLDGGTISTTITLPSGPAMSYPVRLRVTMAAGVSSPQILLSAGAGTILYQARIICTQTGASKTAIYESICGDDGNAGQYRLRATHSGGPDLWPRAYYLWNYLAADYGGTVVVELGANIFVDNINSTFSASFQLRNHTDADAVVCTCSTSGWTITSTMNHVTKGIYATATGANLHDGDQYQAKFTMTAVSASTVYSYLTNGWLRITITDLTKAKIPFQVSRRSTGNIKTTNRHRIIIDPSKFSQLSGVDPAYDLSTCFYRAGAAGDETVILDEMAAPYSDRQSGGHVDAECYAGDEAWTQNIVAVPSWPPKSEREFVVLNWQKTAGWITQNTFLYIKLGQTSSFSRDATFEVPIELTDWFLSNNTTSRTYGNTKLALDTADYNGSVRYFFEIVCDDKGFTNPIGVSLIDEANTVKATKTIRRPGVQRVEFTPNTGLDYYRVAIGGSVSANIWNFMCRLVVNQLHTDASPVTKTRVYIPMIAGYGASSTGAKIVDGYSIFFTTSTTYSQNSEYATLFQKDATNYGTVATGTPVRFEVIGFAGGTTASCVLALWDNTSGGVVAGSELTTSNTIATYGSVDLVNLADGKEYQIRVKRSGESSYNENG